MFRQIIDDCSVIEIDSVEGGSPYSLTLTSSHEWRKEVGLSLNSSLSFDLSSEDKTPQNDEEKIKESCSSQQKPTRKQKEVVTSEDKASTELRGIILRVELFFFIKKSKAQCLKIKQMVMNLALFLFLLVNIILLCVFCFLWRQHRR